MTKGEIVDQCLIKINAGRVLGDVPVHRSLVENLLPPAINFVIVGEYRLRRDERRGDLAAIDTFAVDPEFLGTYEVEVKKDSQRGRYYLSLPHRVQSIPHGLGLDEIIPCNGQFVQFHKVNSEVILMALDEDVLNTVTAFWLEQVGSEQKIYFHNLSSAISKVIVKAVVSVKDLKDTDELPVPDGAEMRIIDLLFQHFVGYRQLPVDTVADGK